MYTAHAQEEPTDITHSGRLGRKRGYDTNVSSPCIMYYTPEINTITLLSTQDYVAVVVVVVVVVVILGPSHGRFATTLC